MFGKSGLGPPDEAEMAERRKRVSEIQAIVQKILDDPEALAALKRVGVSGDFTEQEHEIVFDRSGLSKYFTDENVLVAKTYETVGQTLARRVAAGVYDSLYAKEAEEYALANTFEFGPGFARIEDQRISLEDFLIVLKEFSEWDGLEEHLAKIADYLEKDEPTLSYHNDMYDLKYPLGVHQTKIFRKYGHVGRFDVTAVFFHLQRAKKTIDDIDEILEAAKYTKSLSRIEGIF